MTCVPLVSRCALVISATKEEYYKVTEITKTYLDTSRTQLKFLLTYMEISKSFSNQNGMKRTVLSMGEFTLDNILDSILLWSEINVQCIFFNLLFKLS